MDASMTQNENDGEGPAGRKIELSIAGFCDGDI